MGTDTDSDIDIRQSGVVAKKYTSEVISTDDENGYPSKETEQMTAEQQEGSYF